ncbi:MAG: Asp-tRNA(Asn)/Glu-tRNA(Gln) amidotransferase subunit GatB [Oscillospiraceae bacterium]|nr:Asp-tRNA(Asn)/Glu-tRNA(Gln) amidotransferase subunit GatB [Oscillospiraceae bacterium]
MSYNNYEIVMGIEVHVELAVNSKLFCSCSAKFGAEPNENTCPSCLGMPGFIPHLNKNAVELAIKAGLVTNSEIAERITFDKKNYFYPDLPSGYQTTQWFSPICQNGGVEIEIKNKNNETETKIINLKQIHIEEDAGKLVHGLNQSVSTVDYNRAGVPLIEIVSQPDFRSSEEVVAYLQKLRSLFIYAGVSDCKMHEGSMRADINISVRKIGDIKLGTRIEIKNMNSLKAIVNAIEYEKERQIEALETGCEELIQETRRWDEEKNESFSMRTKEDATDYRYFPHAEVMPVAIPKEWIEDIKASLPELAHQKLERFIKQYNLSGYDAKILTENKRLSELFEETTDYCGNPKEAANWLIVELLNLVRNDGKEIEDIKIDCRKIASLIKSVLGNIINRPSAKEIFEKIYKEDADPEEYIKENNLGMISNRDLLYKACEEAVAGDPDGVKKYKNGNIKVFGSFVGSVMRKMKGKANTDIVNGILKEMLDGDI